MEARIGAEVYDEPVMLEDFLTGSGDSHALYAKVVFHEELKDIATKDVKRLRPDLRNKVKDIEFAFQFGSDGTAAAKSLGITVKEARQLVSNILSGMKNLAKFKKEKSKFVCDNGYVVIHEHTGHRGYWPNWKYWKKEQDSYTREFWDDYKLYHKGTNSSVEMRVKNHFKEGSKWKDRMILNLPTQGGGAIVIKDTITSLFNWIVDNGYFNKIKLVNVTHDECNTEFPEELKDTYPKIVEDIMLKSAAKYYHKLPIPAEASVGDHWIH